MLQPAAADPQRWPPGDRVAANADFVVAVPYGFRVDQFDTDVVVGRPIEVDLLGFVAELLAATGDHGVYDHSDVLGGSGECGEFVVSSGCFMKGKIYIFETSSFFLIYSLPAFPTIPAPAITR